MGDALEQPVEAPAPTARKWPRRVLFGLAALLALVVSQGWLPLFAASLILAFGVRLVYVVLRRRARRPLLSGWIFVIALALLVTAAAGSHGRKLRHANAAAVRQGVVERSAEANRLDRCVGLLLDWWDKEGARKAPEWTKPRFRVFVTRVCLRAAREHVLRDDGDIEPRALHRLWTT
jgi:hypothetical protein